MSEELMFTCEICGKQFPPDPDTMVEAGLSPVLIPEGSEPPADLEFIPKEDLEFASEETLAEMGLTPEQRDALLRGEEVTTGGMCICAECQDAALKAEGGES